MFRKILVIAIVQIVFACVALDLFAKSDPIRIGLSLGLSGRYSVIAKMQERAFRLWEKSINEQGGLLGRQVSVTIHDDRSSREAARRLYQQMIEQEKMDLLFPPYSSGITGAILPITEKHGYSMLIHGAAADSLWQQGYKYAFGVLPPASRYTLGFLEMLLMNSISKVAIFSAEGAFSKNIAKGAVQWAKRLGIEITLQEVLGDGPHSFVNLARQAKKSGVQALVMCGHFNEAISMRQALLDIKWQPKAYWASVGPVFQSYYDYFDDAAENTFSATQWIYYERLPFPGSKEFYQTFLETYGVEPSYHAASAYTAGVILASAIQKAKALDKERIRDILSSLDKMTLLGRYGVDRTGMQIRFFHFTIQWIDGHKEVVWPLELSSAQPRFP